MQETFERVTERRPQPPNPFTGGTSTRLTNRWSKIFTDALVGSTTTLLHRN